MTADELKQYKANYNARISELKRTAYISIFSLALINLFFLISYPVLAWCLVALGLIVCGIIIK